MKPEEEVMQLRAENQALQEQLRQRDELIAQLQQRMQALEERVSKTSRTSHKPPSSDGLSRPPRSSRRPSGKPSGGQAGHPGHTLQMVELPDEVQCHRPSICSQCQEPLSQRAGVVIERRQVHDVPISRLMVREHQIEAVCCPACHHLTRSSFPEEAKSAVQYGPNVASLAVYLHQGQLLPVARTCEALAELYDCHICEGTLLRWVEMAGERLLPTVERIAEMGARSPLQHGDETGIRIYGMLHWLHVNCTRFLTHLAWHPSRGREAMEEIGIWPRFAGRGIHDRWTSYDAYPCAHSICGAHLLRDCAAVEDEGQQEWAADMQTFLLDLHQAVTQWRERQVSGVPALERDEWVARYFEILAAGYAAQPPPSDEAGTRRRGRRKQSAAKNLLDALLHRADQVLALLDDLGVPFTNNQAERDLRMAKVQQKIAGTFRSATGATAFCRIRSYLSTMQKQGHTMLSSLVAVFNGKPFPVAWGPK